MRCVRHSGDALYGANRRTLALATNDTHTDPKPVATPCGAVWQRDRRGRSVCRRINLDEHRVDDVVEIEAGISSQLFSRVGTRLVIVVGAVVAAGGLYGCRGFRSAARISPTCSPA
jgi:hypothetical protein